MPKLDTMDVAIPAPEAIESSFSSKDLPRTAAALSSPSLWLIRALIAALDAKVGGEGLLDRITARVYPQCSPWMVAHYINKAPPLRDHLSAAELAEVDRRVEAFVVAVAKVRTLQRTVGEVRRDEKSAEEVVRELLERFAPVAPLPLARTPPVASTVDHAPAPEPRRNAVASAAPSTLAATAFMERLDDGSVALRGLGESALTLLPEEWLRLLGLERELRDFFEDNYEEIEAKDDRAPR